MALWRFLVATKPDRTDPAGEQAAQTLSDFGLTCVQSVRSARIFLIDSATNTEDSSAALRIVVELLSDPVVESCQIAREGAPLPEPDDALVIEVAVFPPCPRG